MSSSSSSEDDDDWGVDDEEKWDSEDDEEPYPRWPQRHNPPNRPVPPPPRGRNTRILPCWRELRVVTYTDLSGEVVVVDLTGDDEHNNSQAVPDVTAPAIEVVNFALVFRLTEGHFR